jgi:hypothetical protein
MSKTSASPLTTTLHRHGPHRDVEGIRPAANHISQPPDLEDIRFTANHNSSISRSLPGGHGDGSPILRWWLTFSVFRGIPADYTSKIDEGIGVGRPSNGVARQHLLLSRRPALLNKPHSAVARRLGQP